MGKNLKFKIVLAFVFLISVARFSWGADDFSVGVYPPILEIWAKPGVKVKAKVRVFNNGDINRFKIYPVPARPVDELGNVDITTSLVIKEKTDKERFRFLEWAAVYKGKKKVNEVEIETGKSKDLDLVVFVPKKAENNEHFFTLLIASKAKGKSKTSSSLAVGRVGINVILTVSDKKELVIEGKIEEFGGAKLVESGPVPFVVRVGNTGKNHFKAKGDIEIFNIFDKKVDKVMILPAIVMPGTIRRMVDYESFEDIEEKEKILGVKSGQTNLEKGWRRVLSFFNKIFFPKKIDKKEGYVVWKSGFLLGRYKAKLNLEFDGKGAYNEEFVFWAIPIRLILGVIVAVLILIMIKKRVTAKN